MSNSNCFRSETVAMITTRVGKGELYGWYAADIGLDVVVVDVVHVDDVSNKENPPILVPPIISSTATTSGVL